MENRRVFKCFISSPGDCKEEREACQSILNKLNNSLARRFGIHLEPFMWEHDVLPDMGRNGQEIIDEDVNKSDYDLFIGIMKNRFGHPTKKAGSGTEHEFNDALKRKLNSQDSTPRILFFFGKENVDPNDFNFNQFEKVKEFKAKTSSNGLYIEFTGIKEFNDKLNEKLELFITHNSNVEKPKDKIQEIDNILKKLEDDLDCSLKTYNEKSPVWIDPVLSTKREVPINPTKNGENKIEIKSIIEEPKNIVIKAPSEFGLTSLAHYLKLNAWNEGKTFLYIDAKKTKKHKIVKDVSSEVKNYYNQSIKDIDCILLDSICFEEQGVMKMVKNLSNEYKNIPIIILNTLDNNFFLKSDEDDKVHINREFISYYLLPLSQNEVRKIVSSYASIKSFVDDTDVTLNKVTKDLETLNMHRTPKNCISILKASSKMGAEYRPINRTKLLEIILNGIFQDYELPTYHDEKPDIKDCSFVLGYLCEILVKRNEFDFTDDFFRETLTEFCKENFIELDLKYLLSVLIDNSIIVRNRALSVNYFKNTYWVFYFIAHRMEMSSEFRKEIYKNKKYIDFPEIIEFYTGIDRNKEDALEVLEQDIDITLKQVREKVNIPNELNPFNAIKWNPDISVLEKEDAKISEDVISSGLPDEVKDRYEDKQYNQIRPYNQVINSVMRDYSFLVLMRQISATSRALRNSSFVNKAGLKKRLLNKITQGWNEINKLLIVLSPLLADKGDVAFEGARFYLDEDDFNIKDPIKKRLAVLLALPTNVVKFFKDDLYSVKIGPLLIDEAVNEKNSLLKHELMVMLIAERPKNWRTIIDDYIVSLKKDSFFLSDVLSVINFNIEYKATEVTDVKVLKLLAKKCRAKYFLKDNNPSMGQLQRLDKIERGSRH